MHREAVEALIDALADSGLRATASPSADVVLQGPTGVVALEVKAISVAGESQVRAQIARHRDNVAGRGGADSLVVLVADQMSRGARELLRAAGWGYLDRRGALWLHGPGLVVHDTSLAPIERHRPSADGPIRGRVGVGVALALLMYPRGRASVRQLAGTVEASPSTVHDSLAKLREHALVDSAGAPLIPDLFNAAADVWRPDRIAVQREPLPGDEDLQLGLHDDETGDVAAHGWVVGGDVGAAAAGARIVVGSGAPPDFYVPSEAVLRRALRRLGPCPYEDRGATIAVAPSPVVTSENHYVGTHSVPWLHWPWAHPVVIALDLAQDLARGREVLDEWTPQGFDRVW